MDSGEAGGGLELIEATLPGGKVVFTTRRGGVSDGPWRGLNLGLGCGDRSQDVIENRRLLSQAVGLDPENFRSARQVHGGRMQHHSEPVRPGSFLTPEAGLEEADGHYTNLVEVPLMVTVADCAPVFLAGPDGVALLHCGWRSLLTDLILRGAEATGGGRAVIGPCIGPCCFEVGPDVDELFAGEETVEPGRLDLAKLIAARLKVAGIEEIEVIEQCTSCNQGTFFSHRRDGGQTGRQAAIGWRTAA